MRIPGYVINKNVISGPMIALQVSEQVVKKRYERRKCKEKFEEKTEFMHINEHFESNFNAVLSSAIVFQ